MMSGKSKKGFKKLNSHEMVKLNSNGDKLDSGSEDDLMDLTMESHQARGSCCYRYLPWDRQL